MTTATRTQGKAEFSCPCDWPYGHCETCARVWGYTAVHMTADGTCAMYGHREGDLT